MKKVTAIIGSARKKMTVQAVQEFERNLKQYGDIEFETVFLSEYRLEFCDGCGQCLNRGEEFCPLKDDRDALLRKLEQSDGVVFATPSYAFQVTGRMKNLLDRIAFIFHRPRFFGKTCTAIVTQGIPMGGKIRKYLESSGENLGFTVVKGSCVWTMLPMTGYRQKKLKREMEKAARRFYHSLARTIQPAPSLLRLLMFRFTRTGIRHAPVRYYDYEYFQRKGWFESEYYCETALGPFKKLAGLLFDLLGRRLFAH